MDKPHLSVLRFCMSTVIFLSGACALLYEVAWVRMMGLVVGSTTQAASCVIAAFLGGLALGGWLCGKLSGRSKIPQLVAYGLLELGIALTAPLTSWLLQELPATYAELTHVLPQGVLWLTAERLFLASLLLLPPTVLMGATLPVVTAVLVKYYARPAHYFSILYGLNTLGAVIGSLAGTFLAFPFLGIMHSIFSAAFVNLALALTAFVLSRFLPSSAALPAQSDLAQSDLTHSSSAQFASQPLPAFPPDEQALATRSPALTLSRSWLYAVAAFLGFTALSYEILWIRLVRIYIGSSTYSFTAMVSTFLMGLFLGSMIYNGRLKKNPSFAIDLVAQLRMLSLSQAGAAVLSLVGILILPGASILVAGFLALNAGQEIPFSSYLLFYSCLSFCLMIGPSTFIGVAFPLIGGLAASTDKDVARAVGSTYAANTAGCILGSLVCGLLLIPTIGSQYTLELIAAITAATSVAIELRVGGKGRIRRILVLAVPIFLTLVLVPQHYLEKMYCRLTFGELLAAGEDAIGRVLCVKYKVGKRLIVNGTMYSSDMVHALRYMRALGHLPVLLNSAPKDVLVVCFGIGTTAGAVAKHEEVNHVDVCEISPAVLSCADLFQATNSGVIHNPKVTVQLEDGRNFLLRTNKKYDVISFEPPPPNDAGVVNLYSREFYSLCQKHLNPGGILCQWAPMHGDKGNEPFWKMMLKSADVFGHVTVWLPSSMEALIIASDQPIRINMADMEKRIESSPAVKRSLMEVGLADPYSIAATYLIGDDKLKRYLSDAEPVTDDHPSLEFFLPVLGRSLYPNDLEPYVSDVNGILELNGQLLDENKLQNKVKAMRELREASTQTWKGNNEAAKQHIARALQLDPGNQYILDYGEHPELK